MTAVIAEMLLEQMNESETDSTHYRGQRITRRYLRHVIWKANCYSDHFMAMKYARNVLPLEGSTKCLR